MIQVLLIPAVLIAMFGFLKSKSGYLLIAALLAVIALGGVSMFAWIQGLPWWVLILLGILIIYIFKKS